MPDYIQNAVNEFEVPQGINYNVVLVHYLAGTRDNPYELRRTNVILRDDSYLQTLIDPNANRNNIHVQSMQEYIRYIDRDNTFLK